MIHWLRTALDTYFAHPLKGNGYQWWSGAGSDLGEATLVGLAIGWLKHHNCREKGCWRLGHAHPAHGQPVCWKHRARRDREPIGRTTSDDGGAW